MSYQQIECDAATPTVVKNFIRSRVDMQFADIHCMLRLPIIEINLHSGCNFAAANSLLSLISGLSVLLTDNLNTSGQSEIKFKEVLSKYYPWNLQPPRNSDVYRTIDHLYKFLRNPLAHSLGIKPEGNFLVTIRKDPLNESEIEKLEYSDNPPGTAITYSPININGENIEMISLDIPAFYWGVRKMVELLTADTSQIIKTAQSLESKGVT